MTESPSPSGSIMADAREYLIYPLGIFLGSHRRRNEGMGRGRGMGVVGGGQEEEKGEEGVKS